MFKDNKEKNPFFIPALIATLIPVVIMVFCLVVSCFANVDGVSSAFDALENLLVFLACAAPFVAIILSVAGLVNARKLQEPFRGCLICLVSTLLEVSLFFIWLNSYPSKMHENEVPIVSRSLTPEESAEIESINEEINRALNEKPARRNEK